MSKTKHNVVRNGDGIDVRSALTTNPLIGLIGPSNCVFYRKRTGMPNCTSVQSDAVMIKGESSRLSLTQFLVHSRTFLRVPYETELTANSCIARSSSRNAVSISSARTMKHLP